jgi:hypothetical protein
MSSLFLRNTAVTAARAGSAAAAAWLLFGATSATGADIFYQPIASLSTNANSNVDLVSTGRQFAEGYFADAATIIGIATPTSETTIMPRLLYNYYPTQSALNRLEGFLDMSSHMRWERNRFDFFGFFDHRDDLNAETPGADFGTVAPGVGNTTGSTGRINLGATRNYWDLLPTYSHNVTPLSSIGVGAEYQGMAYNPDDTSSHIDYSYYLGRLFYTWAYNARTDFTVSGFGSKYIASNIDSNSTSGGVQADARYNWSQAWHSDFSVLYSHTKQEETSPRVFSGSASPWGATIDTVYTGANYSYRAYLGRTIAPSSAGGLYTTNQARGQYDRDITPRLHFSGAVRYFRTQTVTKVIGDDTRDYVTATTKLQWMVTRTVFIAGAYTYVWQKYRVDPASADTNILSFQIGYRGLERQH